MTQLRIPKMLYQHFLYKWKLESHIPHYFLLGAVSRIHKSFAAAFLCLEVPAFN